MNTKLIKRDEQKGGIRNTTTPINGLTKHITQARSALKHDAVSLMKP